MALGMLRDGVGFALGTGKPCLGVMCFEQTAMKLECLMAPGGLVAAALM